MNKLTVLFFATLKDNAGTERTIVEIPTTTTVQELKAILLQSFPGLAGALDSVLVSVNQEYAFDEDRIPAEAEVALFPPVSGGSDGKSDLLGQVAQPFPTIYAISAEPLNLDVLLGGITLPTTGAACIFTGMVRAITNRGEAHQTAYLHYEAYKPMAEAKMIQVADEIRARWPAVEGIAIVQRIGRLDPGTPTVLIACTAAHRDTGVFEAARYGIDRLKEIVPVWKKEVGPAGNSWVEGSYFPTRGD